MTAPELTAVAGIVLQVLFEYVPGAATWYQDKAPVFKRLFMAVILLLIGAGSVLLSCYDLLEIAVCNTSGIIDTLLQIGTAAGIGAAANQGTHQLLKKA